MQPRVWVLEKSVSDIRIRFESNFWTSLYACKLTILPDIQPTNRIVIIFDYFGLFQVRENEISLRKSSAVCSLQRICAP